MRPVIRRRRPPHPQMDADLGAPPASRGVEVHRAGRHDIGSGKGPSREHLVLNVVDDLRVPFDGQTSWP